MEVASEIRNHLLTLYLSLIRSLIHFIFGHFDMADCVDKSTGDKYAKYLPMLAFVGFIY